MGKDGIDLARAMEILTDTFGVKNAGVVGGAAINTVFLDAGLLDEIIILIGAGIDGRANATFLLRWLFCIPTGIFYCPLFNALVD